MADKKISALTSATTPLAGTEVLPIVQASTTVKVAVSDLTAGRTFSALGMTLTSTDAGANEAPTLDLYRDSATPAASDTLAEIQFNGEDSAGNKQKYACIHGSILSPTSTAEAGQIHFETQTAGASTEKMIIGTTNLVINEIGAVFNVRIEGDTDANLFYTDATNSRIGVGTISPAQKLDVVGAIKSSDNVIQGTAAKGFNFTANTAVAGMSSQLLNWYEEGAWNTAMTADGGTVTLSFDRLNYTRSGRIVSVSGEIVVSAISSPTGDIYISVPFTNSASTTARSGVWSSYLGVAYTFTGVPLGPMVGLMTGSATKMTIRVGNNAGGTAASGFLAVGTTFNFGFTYQCQ